MGPDNLQHPMNRKVRCQVYLRDLQEEAGLTDAALQHIALVCGPRCKLSAALLTVSKIPQVGLLTSKACDQSCQCRAQLSAGGILLHTTCISSALCFSRGSGCGTLDRVQLSICTKQCLPKRHDLKLRLAAGTILKRAKSR